MDENKAIQVSQEKREISVQTREMIEHGAQAMLQQAVQYLQDAIHASKLRQENERLKEEIVSMRRTITEIKEENAKTCADLASVQISRDVIAQHRDQLLSESAAIHEKFRRLRHSMDTMRGIMESNLAA